MNKYIIEARNAEGQLDFADPQPPVRDFTENELADFVFRHVGDDVILDGREVCMWPSKIDPRWIARIKYW